MKMLYLNDRCKSFLLITSSVYTYVFVPCPRTKCLEDDDEIRVFSKFCTLSTRNFLITVNDNKYYSCNTNILLGKNILIEKYCRLTFI